MKQGSNVVGDGDVERQPAIARVAWSDRSIKVEPAKSEHALGSVRSLNEAERPIAADD